MPNYDAFSIKYIISLIVQVLIAITILIIVSIKIQPLSGDLTRIGGYAERDFGWNAPRKVLSSDTILETTYDKYYDIVVVGDSFSKLGFWQSILAGSYGLSFTTLYWDNITVEEIINSKVYLDTPPKLLIVEMGARTFPRHFISEQGKCDPPVLNIIDNNSFHHKMKNEIHLEEINRDTSTNWSEINLKFALVYLQNSVLRYLFDNDFTKVKNYYLSRNDLFSNKLSNEVLVLNSWLESKAWSDQEIGKLICNALQIQNRVQSNGKTLFILLLIPDKGTSYYDYIIEPKFSGMKDLTNEILSNNVRTPKLSSLLQNAIRNGEKDIYLPNDTHFGTLGYQLTAMSIINLLDEINKDALINE